jgi:hypothetical protein
MANNDWQQVGGTTNADSWKPEKEGDSIEGQYIDKRENVGPNGSNLYTLEQEDGTMRAVWGSTVIDDRMSTIKLGDMVKLVYVGKVPSKTPGRSPAKVFDVFRKPAPEGKGLASEEKKEDVNPDDIPF